MLSSGYQAAEVRTGYQSYKKGFIGEKSYIFTIHHSLLSALEAEKYHNTFIYRQCGIIQKCDCFNLDPLAVSAPWKICNFKHTYLCTDLQNSLIIRVTYSFLEIRHLFQHLMLRLFQQEHHPNGEVNITPGYSCRNLSVFSQTRWLPGKRLTEVIVTAHIITLAHHNPYQRH